ncbi:MAG: division/cell wall cluster transcriptional repressor MraZ [Sphingomonas sp.]
MRLDKEVGVAGTAIFQGYALQLVDDKGRVAIPAALRSTLFARMPGGMDPKEAMQVVVGLHESERCLIAFDPGQSVSRFNELEARAIAQAGPDGAPRHDIIRAGMAVETLPYDASGRFILPGFPRKRARINRYAFFFGLGRHFEIWDPATLVESDHVSADMKEAVAYFLEERGETL